MKALKRSVVFAAALFAVIFQQATAGTILYGTVGSGPIGPGSGPRPSTLVVIDPSTGNLLRQIGPPGGVGFVVNGLAWNPLSQTLYATTSINDKTFHGLITIDTTTGVGTPVDATVINFGLPVDTTPPFESPIHSITMDFLGPMVAWYDEGPPATSDTFVRIDERKGTAKEFPNTGVNTAQNGLAFDNFHRLWNIDAPQTTAAGLVQFAYLLNRGTGKPLSVTLLSPPTPAALGDFNPDDNLYYGLNFNINGGGPNPLATDLVVVDPYAGTVRTVGHTVDGLHVLVFAKPMPTK